MTAQIPSNYDTALRDFVNARKRAAFRQIMNRVTGDEDELLSYNEVRQQMLAESEELIEKGVREIPVANIVGSVGRYKDFTHDFLPKRDSDQERWTRVRASVDDMRGWQPIEVYQIGDVYFVKDGNHRVSVTRQLGVETISAYVTEVKTNVHLTPNDNPSELIAQANYEVFLQRSMLHALRPDADLAMTLAGGYRDLLHEIETHGRITEQRRGEALSAEQKAALWYDDVYMPVIDLFRQQGLSHSFPHRTETDLYVMLTEHRDELADALGWEIDPETAAVEWVESQRKPAPSPMARLGRRLLDAMVAHDLEDGAEPEVWHKQQRRRKRLFRTVLVALEGIPEDEVTLAQALLVAGWEKSRVNGVHLCEYDYQLEAADGDTVATLFKSQLAQAGLEGELVSVYEEDEARPIIDRARWSDLVVVSLTNPPGPDMSGRRGNLFIRLIQQSPRPILAVSGKRSPLDHALVAYDGSPKADEALFLAARAAQRWESALTVLTVTTQHTSGEALDAARAYLEECRVEANYVLREQHIADAILAVSAELGCDWLIMGGFGFRPMRHLMLGSTVDRMLREFPDPILICR